MLNYVPIANELINEDHKQPVSGPHHLTDEMCKAMEDASKPKKGGKRKPKVGPYELTQTPKKKVKRDACMPRSPSPDVDEDSESHTIFDVRRTEPVKYKLMTLL